MDTPVDSMRIWGSLVCVCVCVWVWRSEGVYMRGCEVGEWDKLLVAHLWCKEVWSKHGAKVQAVHFVFLRMLLYFVKETTVKGQRLSY